MPEPDQVKGKLAVMPDGKKGDMGGLDQIEDHVLVQDEFPQLLAGAEQGAQALEMRPGLQRSNGAGEKRTARVRELAQRGRHFVENAGEESGERSRALWAEEEPDVL